MLIMTEPLDINIKWCIIYPFTELFHNSIMLH